MSKKGIVVLKYENDYNIVFDFERKDNKRAVLKNSTLDKSWTYQGQLSSTVEDDGDNYIFKFYNVHGKLEKTISLDFSQTEELRVLAKLIDKDNTKCRVLEEK